MAPNPGGWRRVIRIGLIWGAVAVYLCLVGMVELFAPREIVVGVISLAHALLLLTGMAAGLQAGRQRVGSTGVTLGRGTLAGAIVGVVVAALVAVGAHVNLRAVLASASPDLFAILSFGQGTSATPLIILAGAVAGGVGAVTWLVPPRVRRPLAIGVAAVFIVGLFQELEQLLLGEGGVRLAIREIFFTADGLSPRGAVIAFVVVEAIILLRSRRKLVARRPLTPLSSKRSRWFRSATWVLVVALVLVVPQIAGSFLSQVLVMVGLFTLMGLGLNLEVGFAGLLDLGFVAFFAIGAFTVGVLTTTGPLNVGHLSFWVAVPIAVVVALIAGVLFGIPVLGIRGDYLAIATLGFGEITRLMVLSDFLRPWLGGSQGVLSIPKPMLGGFELRGPEQLFYLTLVSSALVVFVAMRLRDSRLGRAWMAIREDEDVAEAMGINLVNSKLLSYGLGAAFAGVGGAIFAVMVGSVFPHSFQLLTSINVLALIVVGGMGSLPGVVVGALFLVGLPEVLREFSEFRFLIYGAALILMMQLRPEGLWPAATVKRELHEGEEPSPLPETPAVAEAKGSDG